jgi:hypothetical protein
LYMIASQYLKIKGKHKTLGAKRDIQLVLFRFAVLEVRHTPIIALRSKGVRAHQGSRHCLEGGVTGRPHQADG